MRRLAYLAVIASLTAVDCRPAPNSGLPVVSTVQMHGGIRFLHLAIGAFDPAAPLVIALHGRGSSPEGFDGVWRSIPSSLEIALPQAWERFRFGWQWFDTPRGVTEEQFARAASAAEEKLWPALLEAAHGRKLVVTGHSQGAIMAYVIAIRHPEVVKVIPVSGGGPHNLMPRHAPTAPVYALHGTDDSVVSVQWARSTIADLRAAGGSAELREFPGAGHGITEEMQRDLFAHVAEAAGAPLGAMKSR
jgi:phospholipase/carboxylesterase